jgi:hypothetical protein
LLGIGCIFFIFAPQNEPLGSACVTGYDFNGGFRDFEAFRYVLNTHLVGRIIHGRRRKLDFKCVAMLTGNHVL